MASPLSSASADTGEELVPILAQLEELVTELALAESLSSSEVDELRRRLARVYRELEDFSKRLDGGRQPGGESANEIWQPYDDAQVSMWPDDARFEGWSEHSEIDLDWGGYGEISLVVFNSYYRADWTIRSAYTGEVGISQRANNDGDIFLTVADDRGEHQFLIQGGGLGPLYVRGLEDEPARPNAISPTPAPAAQEQGYWYEAYLELVHAGQLEDSAEMRWFIDQTESHSYETVALRDLGEALSRMGGGQGTASKIGDLSYSPAGKLKTIEIPDPRNNPAAFAHVIGKLNAMTENEEPYRISLRDWPD